MYPCSMSLKGRKTAGGCYIAWQGRIGHLSSMLYTHTHTHTKVAKFWRAKLFNSIFTEGKGGEKACWYYGALRRASPAAGQRHIISHSLSASARTIGALTCSPWRKLRAMPRFTEEWSGDRAKRSFDNFQWRGPQRPTATRTLAFTHSFLFCKSAPLSFCIHVRKKPTLGKTL